MKKKRADRLCFADVCAPKDLVDDLGWIGALAILAAYSASSFGYIVPADPLYQGLNLIRRARRGNIQPAAQGLSSNDIELDLGRCSARRFGQDGDRILKIS